MHIHTYMMRGHELYACAIISPLHELYTCAIKSLQIALSHHCGLHIYDERP